MLQDTDPSGDKWEGTGLHSIECSCLKAVFPFTNRKDVTKDAVGYHNFSVQEGGKKLVMRGGWLAPAEWGPATSTKTN
jgi:hypothetical protein